MTHCHLPSPIAHRSISLSEYLKSSLDELGRGERFITWIKLRFKTLLRNWQDLDPGTHSLCSQRQGLCSSVSQRKGFEKLLGMSKAPLHESRPHPTRVDEYAAAPHSSYK